MLNSAQGYGYSVKSAKNYFSTKLLFWRKKIGSYPSFEKPFAELVNDDGSVIKIYKGVANKEGSKIIKRMKLGHYRNL